MLQQTKPVVGWISTVCSSGSFTIKNSFGDETKIEVGNKDIMKSLWNRCGEKVAVVYDEHMIDIRTLVPKPGPTPDDLYMTRVLQGQYELEDDTDEFVYHPCWQYPPVSYLRKDTRASLLISEQLLNEAGMDGSFEEELEKMVKHGCAVVDDVHKHLETWKELGSYKHWEHKEVALNI